QIDTVVSELVAQGVQATGVVRVGEVAPGIIKAAEEMGIAMLFVGTASFQPKPRFFMARDPIVHYLVDHCPISLCLIRHDDTEQQLEAAEAEEARREDAEINSPQ